MKLHILIAEDSKENIDTLKILLGEMSVEVSQIGIAKTLEEAREELLKGNYNLALLDIQFKNGTIFEVLDRLIQEGVALPEIVFVTAHGSFEYATRAIKYACIDFVNKPVNPKMLEEAIISSKKKISKQQEQRSQLSLLIKLLEGDLNHPEQVAVILPKGKIEFVKMKDLLFIEADGNTCVFHSTTKSFHSTRPMGYYIDLFQNDPSIVQISRSCIVNRQNVVKYNASTRELILSDQRTLIASHRANKSLKSKLTQGTSKGFQSGIESLKKLLG